jgi:hypothetical protein
VGISYRVAPHAPRRPRILLSVLTRRRSFPQVQACSWKARTDSCRKVGAVTTWSFIISRVGQLASLLTFDNRLSLLSLVSPN